MSRYEMGDTRRGRRTKDESKADFDFEFEESQTKTQRRSKGMRCRQPAFFGAYSSPFSAIFHCRSTLPQSKSLSLPSVLSAQFPVPSSQFSVLSSQPHRIFLSQTERNETPAEQFANYSQLRRELSRRLRATTTKRRQWQWQLLLQHRRCPSAALSFPQPSPHPHPHPQPRRRGPSSSSCVKFVLSFSVSKCAKRFQSNSDARAEKTFGPVCWPT